MTSLKLFRSAAKSLNSQDSKKQRYKSNSLRMCLNVGSNYARTRIKYSISSTLNRTSSWQFVWLLNASFIMLKCRNLFYAAERKLPLIKADLNKNVTFLCSTALTCILKKKIRTDFPKFNSVHNYSQRAKRMQ
jgi:hypothetical protein